MSTVPVRRLLPTVGEEPLDELYLDLDFPSVDGARPYLYVGMVAGVDGAVTVAGRSRDLGGAADAVAFSRLRAWADVILVGAGTVRIEDYGPPRTSAATREWRTAMDMSAFPRIVVVTASGEVDPAARLFDDPERTPLIVAAETTPRANVDALRQVAEVWTVGRGPVDLPAALAALRDAGVARVCCEGGPTLNGELLAHGLVDELFLTVTPVLAPRSPLRIVEGDVAGRHLELRELREHAGELLLRYRLAG